MKYLLSLSFCLVATMAFSQEPAPEVPPTPTVEELMNVWTLLTSALITLFTFLSGLFPNVVIFKDDKKRDLGVKALIATIVIGAVMVAVGPVSSLQVVIAFAMAVLSYDKVLRPLGVTTKTEAGKPKEPAF